MSLWMGESLARAHQGLIEEALSSLKQTYKQVIHKHTTNNIINKRGGSELARSGFRARAVRTPRAPLDGLHSAQGGGGAVETRRGRSQFSFGPPASDRHFLCKQSEQHVATPVPAIHCTPPSTAPPSAESPTVHRVLAVISSTCMISDLVSRHDA
jgi:hypothetical protein